MSTAATAALTVHNDLRKKHDAPPLQLDDKLSKKAQEYAEAVLSGNIPPETTGLGVNEYQICDCEEGEPPEVVAREAVFGWYHNLNEYNWETPTKSPQESFSASQVLWKSSKTMGIGVASEGDESVVIALYSPPGNASFDQLYSENVEQCSSV